MKEFPFKHGDEFFVEGAAVTVDTVTKVNEFWTAVRVFPTYGEGDTVCYLHQVLEYGKGRGKGIMHTTTPDGQELDGIVNWSTHPPTPGVISSVLDADGYPRFELQLKSGLKIVITENDSGFVQDIYNGDECIGTSTKWNTDYENPRL